MVFYSRQRRQRRNAFKKSYPNMSKIMSVAPKLLPSGYDAAARWGVKRLQELVNTEFDYVDSSSSTTVASAGTLRLLNGMAQGDTASSREGNSIRMKSYYMKYQIANNATAVNTNTRVILVLDKQSNGAQPLVTDILATNTVVSPRNLDNRKRFKILYDKCHSLGTAGPANINTEFYFKNQQTHVAYYNGSNLGTIADIATNALYLLTISDQATNLPAINYYFRLRFIDN